MKYSKIIAGTMTWGLWGKKFPTSQMIEFIQHCIEHKITTFDHADIYGAYTTEADFGKAFSKSRIPRESIQLITKCGIELMCENRENKVKHYNYSKEYIIWSVDNSLKYLQTDYIDLLLLHRPSPLMQTVEIAEAVSSLKQQGKIKDFGVSNFTSSQVELISNHVDVSVNQIEFSLTQHSAMYDGTLDHMMLKNCIPMAWSPLGNVFKKETEQTRRIHKQLGSLMDTYDATEDQLLLAWILKHPSNIHPIIGSSSKQRIVDAVKATDIILTLEDWFLMLAASQGHEVP